MERPTYEQRAQTICLIILTAIAIAVALKLFSTVMIPFVLAVFLTYCLKPLVDFQRRRLHAPHLIAVLVTIVLACLLLFSLGLLASAAVSQVVQHKDHYQAQIAQLFNRIMNSVHLEQLGFDITNLSESLFKRFTNTAGKVFAGTISGIMNVLSNGALVVIFLIFMLAGKSTRTTPTTAVRYKIETQVKRYTLTMVLTSGTTGTLVGLTLSLLGVDFAWMFGFLAFLLNFIPSIGSIIAILLPIPVILLSPKMSTAARILAIVIPALIQFAIGNLLQPKLMGRSLDLHPVAVLLSLIFFGAIWGIVGMVLATPITAVLKIFLEKFEYTSPVANLLSGRTDIFTTKQNT